MSATSPTAQPTTTATLNGLPFATVRGIVETMQRAFPAEYDRIGRGLQVLLASKIVDSPRMGRYLVQSTTDGLLFYETTTLACSCPDHRQHPELRCKHLWALDILSVASAIVARERAEARVPAAQDGDILDLSTPTPRFPSRSPSAPMPPSTPRTPPLSGALRYSHPPPRARRCPLRHSTGHPSKRARAVSGSAAWCWTASPSAASAVTATGSPCPLLSSRNSRTVRPGRLP
jgi:hypothetical protein